MRVPVYERQSTQLRGGDNVPRATDEAFGAGIGRATASLGAAIQSTGMAFGDALQKNQNEQDAITAKIVSAEYEADVQNYSNNLMLNGDPANASMVPGQVKEYADKRKAEYLPRVSGRYQNHFNLSATQSAMSQGVKTNAWATKTSADYDGKRVTEITGKQSAYLLEAPDQLPRATQAVRGVIDEMNVEEWRKNQLREQASIELMAPIKDGYLKRAADLEAKGDFKGAAAAAKEGKETILRLNTEMPMLMGVVPLGRAVGPRVQLAPHDRHAAIQTIWGEARGESPDGQAAVAEIIRNRAIKSGQTATEVVMAKGQFEPWSRPEVVAEMQKLKPGDPKYDAIGKIVDGVFGGEVPDKTAGGTHFYSPTAQAALGRKPPAWATPQTKVASLGTHEFYAPEGAVPVISGKPMQIASSLIGAHERDNRETIAKFIGNVGGKSVDPATTAWCAAFVNSVLAKSGQRGTDSLMAKSFLNYGTATDAPREGDIVVLSRGDPNGPYGHVGFYAGKGEGGTIKVLGGNQGDRVSVQEYASANVLGYRRFSEGDAGRIDTGPVGERVAQAAGTTATDARVVPTPGTGATMAGSAGSANYTKFMKDANHAFDQFTNKTSVGQRNAQNDLNADLASEEESIRQKGGAGKVVSDEKINGAFDAPRIEQIRLTREANMDYNSATSGWRTKTAEERLVDLEKLNPDNRPVGPDYSYRATNYKNAVTLHGTIAQAQSAEQKYKISREIILAGSGRGQMPSLESIDNNPALSPADRDHLLKQYVAAEGDNVAYQATAAKFRDKGAGLFNRLDPTERGHTDRIFNDLVATLGPEAALQVFVDRTGYVPDTAVKAINGGLSSGDAKATQSALQTATNAMVTGNRPFAFEGAKNNDKIEKAAIEFDHNVNERGMTAEAATRRWIEEQTPAYQQGAGKIKKEDIAPRLKKEVSINDLGKGFDLGLFGTDSAIDKLISRDPVVGFNTGQREKAYSAFIDILTEKYAETPNADIELAKKHAIHEMKTKGGWGVTQINGNKILMRYPPEENPGFRGLPNASEIISGQAQRAIKEAGHDVDRARIQLVPTAATPQRVKDGKPGQYYVQWWDEEKGGVQTLQPGKAFEPSAKEAQAEITAKSDKAYLEHRNTPYAPRPMPAEPPSPIASRAAGSVAPIPPQPTPAPVVRVPQGTTLQTTEEGKPKFPEPTFSVPTAGSRAGGSKKKPGGFTAE